jgi:hypothetical protein
VTFEVSWPANTRDADHRSKVWVFVDYRRVRDNAYVDWLRAGIAGTPTATAGGTVSLEVGNTSGFWLQGTAGAFAATVTVPVTVDLVGYAPQFGWCGVAIDRPPNAVEQAGSYTLNGMPDFIIQTDPINTGSTVSVSANTYSNCIYALTDLTGCPGEPSPMPAITDFAASTMTICAGESVTLTATATNAQRYSFDNGVTWDNSSSTVVSPLTTTDYILQVRSEGGCTVTSSTTITVTVHDLPTVSTVTASTPCAGNTAELTATLSSGTTSSMSYTWTIGNAAATTTETNTITTQTLDEDTAFTVTVTNAYGCTSAETTGTISITSPSAEGQTANTCGCAEGLEDCSGTCLSCCVSNCAKWTTCAGITYVASESYENAPIMAWAAANEYCSNKGAGWRLPTSPEAFCMCENDTSLPGSMGSCYGWWTSDVGPGRIRYIIHNCDACTLLDAFDDDLWLVKCVK